MALPQMHNQSALLSAYSSCLLHLAQRDGVDRALCAAVLCRCVLQAAQCQPTGLLTTSRCGC
jgi:hypothetical protein